MRANPAEQQFSEWLLQIGDRNFKKNEHGLEDYLTKIAAECFVHNSIIGKIYGSLKNQLENFSYKAILCLKNEYSLQLNEQNFMRIERHF